MIGKFRIYSFLVILQLFCISEIGLAQKSQLQIQIQLRRQRQQIEFAKDAIAAYPNESAQSNLTQAEALQISAEKALHQTRVRKAFADFNESKRLLELAATSVLKGSARQIRDDLIVLVRQAEHISETCKINESTTVARRARWNQEQGFRKFRQNQMLESLEHLRIAEFLARKVIETCEGKKRSPGDIAIEEKFRFNILLEQSQTFFQNNRDEKILDQFDKALRQATQGDVSLENQNYDEAVQHYFKATRLLRRGIDMARSSSGTQSGRVEERIQSEIQLLETSIQNLGKQIENDKNEKAEFLYERSLKLQNDARRALSSGRIQIARKKVQMAQNAVGRALGFLGSEQTLDSRPDSYLEDELSKLQIELENFFENSALIQSAEGRLMLEATERNLDLADSLLQADENIPGKERILIGQRFLNWIKQMLDKAKITKEKLKTGIREFDKLYANCLKKNLSADQKKIFEEARTSRNTAEMALYQEYLYQASAEIETALTLIRKCEELKK